ncbi:hypothetical protein [Rubellicoccus peritrichatus]|uniref:Uncharacterized protein n=1 Tax=Rubellicoccus peritrichatus TaxID=3080537 RepID=A0AAQ3QV12_9BACT|nr:hypothetical protein [Puniceicoccus sp. CR14]WOO40412.1 hypothetical protein RZN69_17470 [Puniceicoccus sp. CR14]WOO40461.1 hypothetical protein RZN69_17715 [Puniceicoccus sp. CR14]WOO40510.1 hypothetical protein RZN69_17960 [Puniceicoccus sp. CR14]WOO40560.1 hypothetical protein RZN69_18210 [Puniceicoccus sp. CR14]
MSSAKQGAFYWRHIAQNCDDPEKLRQAISMLFQELQAHVDTAKEAGFEMHAPDWPMLSGLALSDKVEDLQQVISKQVGVLEHWRNVEFRQERDMIPPKHWDAHHVAKSILGYDPDIAANTRDEEL